MRFKLFPKLFLAFLLTASVLVLGMALSVNWTFQAGLHRYLYQKEMEQLDKVIPLLENLYVEYGGWDLLRHNPFLFKRPLRNLFKHILPSPPEPTHERSHRPPRYMALLSRVNIFDVDYQLVIGREKHLPQEHLRPLYQEDKIIGWVGLSRRNAIVDRLAKAFYQQQINHYLLIAMLALLLSALAAWLLVKQLLTPIRRLTTAAHALSRGDYQTRVNVDTQDELGYLAADFNQLAHTLERNEQVRRQWIADISHELRTPLAVLRGEIEAMQDGVRDFAPENLKSLHNETLSLAKLVDDLYDLALSDLGALDYRKEMIDVTEIIDDIVNVFRARFQAQNLVVDNHINGSLMLLADKRRLTQLFSNLLENSLRYTDSGGRLEISQHDTDKNTTLVFADSAPGVPTTALDKLFDRLYRLEQSRNRALGGAGLGLSICRNIVEAHDGVISAHASPLGGLSVHVTFPHQSGDLT